jgi:hypothetical protein
MHACTLCFGCKSLIRRPCKPRAVSTTDLEFEPFRGRPIPWWIDWVLRQWSEESINRSISPSAVMFARSWCSFVSANSDNGARANQSWHASASSSHTTVGKLSARDVTRISLGLESTHSWHEPSQQYRRKMIRDGLRSRVVATCM